MNSKVNGQIDTGLRHIVAATLFFLTQDVVAVD